MLRTISLQERIRKAQKLIYAAEVNFFVCRNIQAAKGSTHYWTASDFLLLTSNNAFDAAVGILHTLLSSTKKEEIRLEPILKELVVQHAKTEPVHVEKILRYRQILEAAYPDLYSVDCSSFVDAGDPKLPGDVLRDIRYSSLIMTGLQGLKNLRIEFEKAHFHRIRHQLIGHKNSLQPHLGDSTHVFIKEELLASLGAIIKKLRIDAIFWLGYSPPNPDLRGVLKGVEWALANERYP